MSVFRSWWDGPFTYTLVFSAFFFVGFFGAWWFRPTHIPHNFDGWLHSMDYLLFLLLTGVVWYQIVTEMLAWELTLFMKKPRPMPPQHGLRVALCTAFVPGKEPYDVLERTLKAMVEVTYPHDTWLLDEGDDPQAQALCAKLGVLHFSRFGIPAFNTTTGHFTKKTKAGNYNSWFHTHAATYDVVAQHDMDFVPEPYYLERVLGYFRDPTVAFVGTPQIYGNERESWIAKGASEQAYGFYGPLQKGLFGIDMHLFVGANHAIRVAAHDDIGGYSGHIVEDHLTGMRLYARRWKSVFVPEVLLIGEGPATWSAYFSQQMRWAYGLMDILFRHSPRIMPGMRPLHAMHYAFLQQYYFYGIVQVCGLLLISLYFLFGWQSTSMDLGELLVLYPTFLIIQILIFLWTQRYYIDPVHESGFRIRAKLLNIAVWPVYLVAFFGAVCGKKLNYEVTPKGNAAELGQTYSLTLFIPHLLLGSVSLAGALYGHSIGNDAPQILFWAVVNTVFMYGFFALACLEWCYSHITRFWGMLTQKNTPRSSFVH